LVVVMPPKKRKNRNDENADKLKDEKPRREKSQTQRKDKDEDETEEEEEEKEKEGEEEKHDEVKRKRKRRKQETGSSRSTRSKLGLGIQIKPDMEDENRAKVDPFDIRTFQQLKGHETSRFLRFPRIPLKKNEKSHALVMVEVVYQNRTTNIFYVKLFSDFEAGWYESGMVGKILEYAPEIAAGKVAPISHGRCLLGDHHFVNHLQMGEVAYYSITPSSGDSISFLEGMEKLGTPIITFKWESIIEGIRIMLGALTRSSKSNVFWFVHGDSNEENFLFDKDGTVRMIDFGSSIFCGLDVQIRGRFHFSRKTNQVNGTRDFETLLNVLIRFLALKHEGIDENHRNQIRSFFVKKLHSHSFETIYEEFEFELMSFNN